jgi:anti-sigma factor ChrR (cupin superfamily)
VSEVRINADFSRRVIIETGREPWIASPEKGVTRKPLDRVGGEIARATSLVRYAPGCSFSGHAHELGEEFLVLEGVFSDEHGDYPAGTYVRNPPGSSHAPGSRRGCVIFVKLRQMPKFETARAVVDTARGEWLPGEAGRHSIQRLYWPRASLERVALERLAAGTQLSSSEMQGGEEILVLSGVLADGEGTYGERTWIRNPDGYRRALRSKQGAVYWTKRGHLPREA